MTEKSTRELLKNDGLLAAVFTKHPDWAMAIWEQPCLVMPSTVAQGTVYDSSKGPYIAESSVSGAQALFSGQKDDDFLTRLIMKKKNGKPRGPAALLLLGFLREMLGLIFYNPWLYWKQIHSDVYKEKWRSTYRNPNTDTKSGISVVLNPITKLLFCVFKVFGSPLILVYFAAKFFYVFMLALNIPQFGTALAHSLLALFGFGWAHTIEPTKKYLGTHQYFTEQPNGEFIGEDKDSVPLFTAIRYYIGMIIPLQLFGEREYAETYGKGALSILIVTFMVISALIIIIGGINILIIGLVFFVYMFKTIEALKTSAMGSGSGGK